MVFKCTACGKFMTNTSDSDPSAVSCNQCRSVYHHACVGIQDKNKIKGGWACPECKAKVPRKNNDDTPIKNTSDRELAAIGPGQKMFMSPCDNTQKKTADCSLAEEIKLFREVFRDELSALRNEMQEVRRELGNVSSSLLKCNKRIDDLESRVASAGKQCNKRIDDLEHRIALVESRVTEQNLTNSTGIEATVAQLKAELNERDQELLLNDIDITGIPEAKAENVIHIATLLAAKIGVTISECDIVRAARVGPVRGARDEAGAVRPIVVRLARRALRDELLQAARVRRGATTADMDLPGPTRRFYINERLTKMNRQLFNKARVAAKCSKWKFTWTRDGRIYTRKNEGQSGVRIRVEQDIVRIFGTETI